MTPSLVAKPWRKLLVGLISNPCIPSRLADGCWFVCPCQGSAHAAQVLDPFCPMPHPADGATVLGGVFEISL